MKKFFCFGKDDFCDDTSKCLECDFCNCSGGEEREASETNADHIRSMTDEELAAHNVQDSLEYTVDYDWDDNPVGEYTPCFKTSDGAIFWHYEDAVEYELRWLKQPYKEDT